MAAKRRTKKRSKDRISSLPDEIIHDILDRLQSPQESARTVVLSKRWNHLWLSYPTLEFNSKGSLKQFVAASSKKCSQIQSCCSAVRIYVSSESSESDKEWSSCLKRILNLASNLSPREIDIRMPSNRNHYSLETIPIPPRLLLDNQFNRLEIVKLENCDFSRFANDTTFPGLASSLKVLHFCNVRFPDDGQGRILTNLIAGASRLETLNLSFVDLGIQRFQVRQHPSLKFIQVKELSAANFEIIGANSLEILQLSFCKVADQKMPVSLPIGSSLRILRLTCIIGTDDRILDLNGMIATASLLEKLSLIGIEGIPKLQIQDHPNLKALEVIEGSMDEIVITESPSLEMLSILSWRGNWLHFSSTPNLKVLNIDALRLQSRRLSELIAGVPSLESLTVHCNIDEEGYVFRVLNCDKLREFTMDSKRDNPSESVIEIVAPKLTKFSFNGSCNDFPSILLGDETAYQSVAVVAFHCLIRDHVQFGELKQFLAKLSKFQVTVEFDEQAIVENLSLLIQTSVMKLNLTTN